ncbi:Hypothetical predicted protein [Paramuricea clavata]|uniref:Uncharacterized protein n=1 Tax=Paramuricea clavata TaxID=317549 RepID=A0A7D9D7J5_PARCT|nr:Hypothetical predicted protein [Paramuricea clavata]
MATTEFIQFVNYMGINLSESNMIIYTNLYVNFVQFQPAIFCENFAEKFILWKRLYDEYKATQDQIINTDLFNTPPADRRKLKPSTTQLPEELSKLRTEDETNLFQNFTLKNESPETKNDFTPVQPAETLNSPKQSDATLLDTTDNIMANIPVAEVVKEIEQSFTNDNHIVTLENITPISSPSSEKNIEQIPATNTDIEPSLSPNRGINIEQIPATNTGIGPSLSPSRGKNIEQMKIIFETETSVETTPSKPVPTPRKRKRKEPSEELGPGPGRPTKDSAMLCDAKNVGSGNDSGNDDEAQLSLREVTLMSGNGAVRKINLLTKYEKDIKCFHIKHYASLRKHLKP